MSNDSSTGGYLLPSATPPAPVDDTALDILFQNMVVALTGFPDPSLVRPRWQPSAPQQPANTVNWIALGVQSTKADTFAYEDHQALGNGNDVVQRVEELEVNLSLYGPNADSYAALIRDGLSVPQNREVLFLNGMSLVGVGNAVAAPELKNNEWYYRVDMPITIRRSIIRVYPILTLLQAIGTLESLPSNNQVITDSISVTHS